MQVRVGAYELIRPLGVGGMAETFLAVRTRVSGPAQRVCLKRILASHAADPNFLELFSDEAQLLAKMDHANIVHIYDFGESDGTLYMALELVEGVDLERVQSALLQRRERLQPALAVYLVGKLLSALEYAHALTVYDEPLNVVHRDISPSNILISRRGDVKLTDFGIAKARGRRHRTQSGYTKGKIAYMSPEQVRALELDARSDLFAVGVVLHELLTGVHPFDAPTDVTLLSKILAGDRPPLRSLMPGAPGRLVAAVDALLEVDPENRPHSAREALALLPPCERPIDCQRALAALVKQLEPPGLFAPAAAQASGAQSGGGYGAFARSLGGRGAGSALHEAPTRAYPAGPSAGLLAHEAPTRAAYPSADFLRQPSEASAAAAGRAEEQVARDLGRAPAGSTGTVAYEQEPDYAAAISMQQAAEKPDGGARQPAARAPRVSDLPAQQTPPRSGYYPSARPPEIAAEPSRVAPGLLGRQAPGRGGHDASPAAEVLRAPDARTRLRSAAQLNARRGPRRISLLHALVVAATLVILLLAVWLSPNPFESASTKPDPAPTTLTPAEPAGPAGAVAPVSRRKDSAARPAQGNELRRVPEKREGAPKAVAKPSKPSKPSKTRRDPPAPKARVGSPETKPLKPVAAKLEPARNRPAPTRDRP